MTDSSPQLHQLTTQVKLLQKAVLWSGDRFLILRRSTGNEGGYRAGKWDLPGGNAEWPVQTTKDILNPHFADLAREIREETGLDIQSIVGQEIWFAAVSRQQQQTVIRNCLTSTYFEAAKQVYAVILGWAIQVGTTPELDSIQLSDEHTEFAWITRDQFDSFDFGFAGEPNGFIRQMIFQ